MKLRDILIALITPILLGFGFAIAKPAMEQFPPFLLMGLRFTIAALILIWWFPIPKVFLKKIFLVSLVGGTLTYGLVYSGFDRIDASSATLLVQAEVPFGVIIAYFLLKERTEIKNILGFTPKLTIEDAVRELCVQFKAGKIPSSFEDDGYFNVRRLKRINAQ